ncbi:hypothetical protein BU649_01025 [Staphylococcus chromogenes]|uniref:Lipoprotein n=1 Tax=Staphylococcus chromogenes TaxID=46126 RepID=A0AAX0ZGL4_STACR|nr:hypothetical protein [Staphylococcus chromogenes]KDP12825.1 putative lipoprotein [Staphylococcus chromogenes MU 970]MBV5137331.1 hypothetical protein [Staphylococcus chromogenes]MBW6089776.1 hypothetical protein [Staphylococcus chromogenes]MCD9059698.1 hypothetical protein [Staphylococcus chromogenes]MCD9062039.1 hypothetical protein [Staphylococcus chromogenes]
MKKWLASFMALSLILAACGQTDDDEIKKNDSSSSKTEQHPSKDHSKTKDSKDKTTNEKATSQEDENQATSDSSGHQETTQSNSSSPQSTQDNQNMNRTEQHQSNSNASNQENTQQGQSYVAPYHGQNVVPVAQNLAQNPVNQQQALKQLPNFQTSLDVAQKEVTALNGQQNPYNDYAIQGEGGKYYYIFSFLNQSQPGTYMIVTVDQSGNPRIIDPAYRQ